jgi:hypothetical protein
MLKQHVSDLDESTDTIRQDALMEEFTKTQTMKTHDGKAVSRFFGQEHAGHRV